MRGPGDPRLGKIDAVLLSHVHSDHLGDMIQPSANAGACPKPDFSVAVTPNANTVNIVLGKQAPLISGGEMHSFFQAKVKSLGGDPAKLVRLLRFGASTMVGKVQVSAVPAVHSNGLPADYLPKAQADMLTASGLTAYVGPPGGFVLRFSNGLTAYLSGDTGITAEIGGKLTPNSRTAAFQKAARMPVHVPLSGRTMQFDGSGRCVSGC